MAKRAFITKLALFASLFSLLVIGLGAFTRLLDAGLGCPDWPGCYGQWVVSSIPDNATVVTYKAWTEMVHRYFVGILSFFILAIVFCVYAVRENRTKSNIILTSLLLLLLAYQILLGSLTVTLKLLPVIVSQHLLGGFLILATLWFIFLTNRQNTLKLFIPTWIKIGALLGLILLFCQIMLGAWTSTNYASLSCSDFPFCQNNEMNFSFHFKEAFQLFTPVGINYEGGVLSMAVRQTIQMIHRLGALVISCYLFFYAMIVFHTIRKQYLIQERILTAVNDKRFLREATIQKQGDSSKEIVKSLLLPLQVMLLLLLIQITLGISNVIFKLPVITAVGHTIGAALLLITLVTFVYYVFSASENSDG